MRCAWIYTTLLVVSCLQSGCTLFSPQKGSITDYENTRRGIENPNNEYEGDDYRPEGATAERESGKLDMLQRIGISKKRRRDIQLAQKFYAAGEQKFDEAKGSEAADRAQFFREAAEDFKQAAKNWQSSSLEQQALLMKAESHFFAEDYYQAEQAYAQLLKEYPRNPYLDHVDSRRFEIADYWLITDQVKHQPFFLVNFSDGKYPWNDTGGNGKRVLEKMRLDNPTGKVSDDATMRLAVEQFEKGKFEDAADTFADLRMTYPDSEHQFQAQFLELQSLLAAYQGPRYSSIPLTEAEKRVKQIATIFPNEASQQQQALNQAYAQIRFLLAERIWEQAEYRRLRSENGSAKLIYDRLLKDYSDTPFATDARTLLQELQDQPDDPPERFAPLIRIFGATTNDRPPRDTTASDE